MQQIKNIKRVPPETIQIAGATRPSSRLLLLYNTRNTIEYLVIDFNGCLSF